MLRLVAAGVLAIPALLWTIITIPVSLILSIPAALLLVSRKQGRSVKNRHDPSIQKRQVVITGGSSGMGLAMAKIAARRSDVVRVVLLARNLEALNAAKLAIEEEESSSSKGKKTEIVVKSVDVSNAAAVQSCAEQVMGDCDHETTSTHLFCCAGEAHPAYFESIPAQSYERLAQTNQLGSIYVTNAFLHYMKRGTVQLCSSMAGQVGVFGYTAYSPTKFALRGYAECLHMELIHNPDIYIQVAYPPDTDTPGFAKENLSKPHETALISEAGGLSSAHNVAKVMLHEALRPNPPFNVYFTFDGFLICTLTAGFSPVTSVLDALAQLSALNLTRWIALLYLADWHRLIGNHKRKVSSSSSSSSRRIDSSTETTRPKKE
jgi:3-dehydrosphinganine reductase